jgi:hypothetical protein
VAFESPSIETGVQIMITLCQYGQIFRDIGRLHVDFNTGDMFFEAGAYASV